MRLLRLSAAIGCLFAALFVSSITGCGHSYNRHQMMFCVDDEPHPVFEQYTCDCGEPGCRFFVIDSELIKSDNGASCVKCHEDIVFEGYRSQNYVPTDYKILLQGEPKSDDPKRHAI